ncbi:MAG: universal stress protein [Solirubrobacterales bacterium]
MNQLVVGAEDTEEGRDALHFARLFAKLTGAELHLVSVHSDTIFYEGLEEMNAGREEYFSRMRDFAETELGDGFEFHPVMENSVPGGLTRIAEEIGADAMVIGSSHRGPIGRVLMGDVGSRLAAGSPCAVILVPRGWGRDESTSFEKVGIAYNGTEDSDGALLTGSELAGKLGAKLLLIGVIPRLIGSGRAGPSNAGYQETLREDMEKAMEQGASRVGPDIERTVRAGNPADELAEESIELDLLVMGSRSYGPIRRVLLGGTSLRVMRSSACPVMVVPKSGD